MSFSLNKIEKDALLLALRQQLDGSLATLLRRQQDTQKAATHAENRPEHSKDTRATEQSYLARGLAVRVDALRQAANQLAKTRAQPFASDESVAIMALVAIRVEDELAATVWWLVPAAGGLELTQQKTRIRTLTPAAPLGRALLGLSVGEEESFATPRGRRSFELLEIA
jgi:transcription elongation GreA/GreB family factor